MALAPLLQPPGVVTIASVSAPHIVSPHIAPPPAAPRHTRLLGSLPPVAPPPPVHAPTSRPINWVGAPNVAEIGLDTYQTRPDMSLTQQVESCLAPGGFSLDPHQAGCTAAYK